MSNRSTVEGTTKPGLDPAITVQNAAISDIPAICAIEELSFPSCWNAETYRGEIDRDIAVFLVAKADGRVVGFSLSWITSVELHILKIAVIPEYRNMGIAEKMMDQTFEASRYKSCEVAFLEVRPSNEAARNFYGKLGFKVLGVRKKYYTDTGEDGIVLVADLEKIGYGKKGE